MENFIDSLFSWIGFTIVAWVCIVYFLYDKFPKVTIDIQKPEQKKEPFAVDLDAYTTNLPTVYSKNCAFDGIKPRGYIPNMPNWNNYSGMLP